MPYQDEFASLLQPYHIPDFGMIPYAAISDKLISCRAMRRIPQNAKTVILMLFPYYIADFPQRNISLYAVVPDYHSIVGDILKKLAADCEEKFGGSFIPFTDSSPIPEKYAASHAGLGAVGKNGLLLHKTYGSYCFIGELVTDIDFAAKLQEAVPCIGCNACSKACPGNVISDSGRDYSGCLSAITQKKKDLTEEEQLAIQKSGFVWGCDRCQTVCPYNRNVPQTPIEAFLHNAVPVITPDNVTALFADRAFAWRGEAVIRRNLKLVSEYMEDSPQSGDETVES